MRSHNSLIPRCLRSEQRCCCCRRLASAQQTIRIAQGVSSLSFLPLWAARALNTFSARRTDRERRGRSPGGDPAALAALDAGDVDLAAVGTETALRAVAKGQPFRDRLSV